MISDMSETWPIFLPFNFVASHFDNPKSLDFVGDQFVLFDVFKLILTDIFKTL